jgi:hypothetical protein
MSTSQPELGHTAFSRGILEVEVDILRSDIISVNLALLTRLKESWILLFSIVLTAFVYADAINPPNFLVTIIMAVLIIIVLGVLAFCGLFTMLCVTAFLASSVVSQK